MKNLLVLLLIFVIAACGGSENPESGTKEDNTKKNEVSKLDQYLNLDKDEMLVAVIETNMGTMEIQLFPDRVPNTVKNFVGLIQKDYYNGIIFHRVIKDFMIQGGDPTGTGRGGQSYYGTPFQDEFHASLRHDKEGVLSMANAGPNTNGSQFFITLKPTPWLDGKHSVFGEIIKGKEVLEAIGLVPTGAMDKPVEDVVMQNVSVEKRSI